MQWKIIWGHVDNQLWVLAEAYYIILYNTIPYYNILHVEACPKAQFWYVSQVVNLPVF